MSQLDALLRRWGASEPVAVAVTPTSRVYRVRLDDGRSAIVKALTPIGVHACLSASWHLEDGEPAGAAASLSVAAAVRAVLRDHG